METIHRMYFLGSIMMPTVGKNKRIQNTLTPLPPPTRKERLAVCLFDRHRHRRHYRRQHWTVTPNSKVRFLSPS